MNNKVVARFVDGRTVKGTTVDFNPGKDVFHVIETGTMAQSAPIPIRVRELKALFFVKDLAGDPHRDKTRDSAPPRTAVGRAIKVVFNDGEVLLGITAGFQYGRPGFFVEPEDPSRNEERCYVVTAATKDITFP